MFDCLSVRILLLIADCHYFVTVDALCPRQRFRALFNPPKPATWKIQYHLPLQCFVDGWILVVDLSQLVEVQLLEFLVRG